MKIPFQLLAFTLLFLQASCTPSSTSNEQPTTPSATVKGLDTAKNANYMSSREKQMIKEINLMRSNPNGYIKYIEAYIKDQEASLENVISGKKYIRDEIKTAKELIRELKKTSPMSTLQANEGLYKAAKIHGQEGKRRGKLNHKGKNGSMPWDRIEKYAGFRNGGENLVGGLEDVRESVIVLLVDSGIPNRGHRKMLLNPDWKYVACYEAGTVGDMPYYWVQNFAY